MPGCTVDLQSHFSVLQRGKRGRSLNHGRALKLVLRLFDYGPSEREDILLQSSTEDMTRYHRLSASVPAKFWGLKTVASWQCTGDKEHINSPLEWRVVLTTLGWRQERHKNVQRKFVPLLDSLVKLHVLSTGRSRSRYCDVKCNSVQPVTRERYVKAKGPLYEWLREESLSLPHTAVLLDL